MDGPEVLVSQTAYDVTVVGTQQATEGVFGLDAATHGAGHQAKVAAKAKKSKYARQRVDGPPGELRSRKFVPLVLESSGYTHSELRQVVRKWGKAAELTLGHVGEREALPGPRVRHRLSSAVHYWNSVAIMSRYGGDLLVERPVDERSGGRG